MKVSSVLAGLLQVQTTPIEKNIGSYMEIVEEQRSWKDAKAFCQKSGGWLATVDSQLIQNQLETLTENRMVWIGARKEKKGNRWIWPNDSYVDKTFDNFNYDWGQGGECARKTKVGSWYMSDCEFKAPFVCQRSVPRVIGAIGGKHMGTNYQIFDIEKYSRLEDDPRIASIDQQNLVPNLSNHCSVYYRGEVWAFGGTANPTATYRLTNGKWRRGPEMPEGRSHFGCSVFGKSVWMCGGQSESGKAYSDCIKFQIRLGKKDKEIVSFELGPQMAEKRPFTPNMVTTSEGLFVIGGTKDSRLIEMITSEGTFWGPAPNLPVELYDTASVVLDDVIYVLGGVLGESNEESGNVFSLTIGTPYWEWAGSLSLPRSGMSATPVHGSTNVMLFGGRGIRPNEIWHKNDTRSIFDEFHVNRIGSTLLTLPGDF